MTTLLQSAIPDLELIHQGKVRDVYALPEHRLLIVATDRLSAFDVVLPDPIPGKGELLTQISNFWFSKTTHIMPNHLLDVPITTVLPSCVDPTLYTQRAVVAKRLKPLPVEAIVRGYLIGSGWQDYQRHGSLCGIPLPTGLQQAQALPQPLFTPSTKAAVGHHDQNISFDALTAMIGTGMATQVRDATLAIYTWAAAYALKRGIILADTKLEFGTDRCGKLHIMDELLTPDSSRYWPASTYQLGMSPPSYDKQFVRDWLETLNWNKKAPGPNMPSELIARTRSKYIEAMERLTGMPPQVTFSAVSAWALLGLAIVIEVIGTSALRLSAGFSRFWPCVVMTISYTTSLYLLSLTLKRIPMGIAYAVWSGVGTVLILAIGTIMFHQKINLVSGLGVGLIIAGVLILNLTSTHTIY